MKKYILLILMMASYLAFSQQLTQAEYFFDSDPGFGQAHAIGITPSNDINVDEMLNIDGLSPGFHIVYLRVIDDQGNWSSVLSHSFYIEENHGMTSEINYVEYFIDDDPGYGEGIAYNAGSGNVLIENFMADMTNVTEGTHQFSMRMRNELQQWSQTYSQPFQLLSCDLGISGMVSNQSGSPMISGFVVLYQYFGEGAGVGVDTVYTTDGSYSFGSVCPQSDYFIKAFSDNSSRFLPTYYGDSPYWEDASIISMSQGNISDVNIQLVEFAPLDPGTSEVDGHIYYAVYKGQPVKNIDMILEKDDDEGKMSAFLAVAADRSDEAGAWKIQNLPNGNYRIKVEIPGLQMDTTYYFSISSPNTVVSNLDYYVDPATGIFIDHFGIEELALEHALQLFPNPIRQNSFIKIKSLNTDVRIENIKIFQYNGAELNSRTVNGTTENISMKSMAKGLYLFQIQTNKGMITKKVIVQ
jgi:hypothetical protein